MAYCDSSFETRQDLLCIDYCREGRMEYAVGNDAFSYVEAGDLKVDRRLRHKGYFLSRCPTIMASPCALTCP